jgi:hypothetical protein
LPLTFLTLTRVAFKEGDREITAKRLCRGIGLLARVLANVTAIAVLGVLKGLIKVLRGLTCNCVLVPLALLTSFFLKGLLWLSYLSIAEVCLSFLTGVIVLVVAGSAFIVIAMLAIAAIRCIATLVLIIRGIEEGARP